MKQIQFAANMLMLVVSIASVPVYAQQDSKTTLEDDRFRFYLGGFYPRVDSKITFSGPNINPPPINSEKTLGVEDGDTVLWGGGSWRISKRNSVEFELFSLKRTGFLDFIPEPIETGNFLIESGTLDSEFRLRVGRLTYGFSALRTEKMDLQLKAGLHIVDMRVSLELAGAICDLSMGETSPCPGGSREGQSEDVMLPLPHLGGSFAYAFTPAIKVKLEAIGFAIEIDNVDGSLLELDADIEWSPWEHFGLGIGLRYFVLDVEASGADSKLNGKFEYEYFGPALYVSTRF